MYNRFVKTSNVERFLAAVAAVDQRGAPEASILLVEGDAGHGKSRTGQWWALQNDAVFIRVKAAATPHWVMTDLVRELGEQAPAHSCEKLFAQAVGFLAKDQRPIVLDEVENGLRDMAVLEIIRDITDLCEIPVVFIGREYVWGRLKRYPHFRTRVSARAEFTAVTLNDVKTCLKELCEVSVSDEVAAEIHRQSDGHVREVIKAIKNVERIGKRTKAAVAMDDVRGHVLIQDLTRRVA